MPSPFPGMNPYLEHPAVWPGVHHWLIIAIADALNPQLLPKYRVAVEVRIYETLGEDFLLVGIPDVTVKRSLSASKSVTSNVSVAEPATQPLNIILPIPETIRQGYLEVREVATKEVVTTIELLSPVNKRSGEGRKKYESKRMKVLGSYTNLIEIDLLRNGKPMPMFTNGIESDYRILMSRSGKRPQADLYTFNLQDIIPTFPLPLKADDTEPIIDLQQLLNGVYERAGYDLEIDYKDDPVPSLSEDNSIWTNQLLKEQGLK